MTADREEKRNALLDEIRDALERSGYLLEARAAQVLRTSNWVVKPNDYYFDAVARKQREIDLTARTWFLVNTEQVQASVHSSSLNVVTAVILAECVNNSLPLAVFETGEKPRSVGHYDDTTGSLSSLELGPGVTVDSQAPWNEMQAKYQGPICTQYCGFRKPKSGNRSLLASHEERDHSMLESLLTACEVEVERGRTAPSKFFNSFTLVYPVLVLQGDLFRVALDGGGFSVTESERERLRLARVDQTTGKSREFLVEVVRERALVGLENEIRADIARGVEWFRSRWDELDPLLPKR